MIPSLQSRCGRHSSAKFRVSCAMQQRIVQSGLIRGSLGLILIRRLARSLTGAQQAAEPPPRRAAEAQHSQGRPVPVGRYSRQRGLQRRRQAGIPGSVHHGTLHYLQFANHTSTAQECGALSSGLRSPYWGLSGARNWELIQPFPRVFSTWTQSPSRPVAVNCVPLGAVPRTGAFAEGADLMLTPGRCKKTRSGFCAVEAVWGVTAPTWGEAAAVSEAATSGEGTTPTLREMAQPQ